MGLSSFKFYNLATCDGDHKSLRAVSALEFTHLDLRSNWTFGQLLTSAKILVGTLRLYILIMC